MLREMSGISGLKIKKRLFILVLVCLGISLLAAPSALAGEYHIGASLICMQCHNMHYSQQHDYSGTVGSGSPTSTLPQATLGGSGPYTKLLRDDVNDLCLSCHNARTFAPDVLGEHGNNYVRQAGGLTMKSSSVGTDYDETNGHTLGWDGESQKHQIPGIALSSCGTCHDMQEGAPNITPRFPDGKLACVSCHEPHGASSHRNLAFREDTLRLITYAKGTNDTSKDVFLRGWTEGNISGATSNYRIGNVDFNEPAGNPPPGMGRFCAKCHGDFHGSAGATNMGGSGGTEWLRHPTTDANIGAFAGDGEHSSLTNFSGHSNRVKVMSPTGDWGVNEATGAILVPPAWAPVPTDLTPTCISCHKAHGNKNPFALIYMNDVGSVTEEGTEDGEYTDLCHQCHIQGVP